MTTKPIAVWCVVYEPKRIVLHHTCASTRSGSIGRMFSMWPKLKNDGYRCKRFILSEAEGADK